MKHRSAYLGLLAVFLVAAGQLAAHHSEAAVYDLSTVMTLKGVVTRVALINPHGSLTLTVKDAAGNSVDWRVELPSAHVMAQRGLGRSLKEGDEITIEVWVARGVPGRATSRMIHLPNGKAVSTMTAWHCASVFQEGCGPGQLAAPAPITSAGAGDFILSGFIVLTGLIIAAVWRYFSAPVTEK